MTPEGPLSWGAPACDIAVREARDGLLRFRKSTDKKYEFEVPCRPRDRIRFIYAVIFPGFQKCRFYGRFFIARIAQKTDISWLKVLLYRSIGMRIGKRVFLSPDVILDPHYPDLIEIGDDTILGWGTHLFAHEFSGTSYRVGRIRIGAGAVVGGFVTIRGGVEIGAEAQIPSSCIVYRDVRSHYCLDSVILLNKALLETYRESVREHEEP